MNKLNNRYTLGVSQPVYILTRYSPCGQEQKQPLCGIICTITTNLVTDSTPALTKKSQKQTRTPSCIVTLKKGGVHHVAAATKDCTKGHASIT